MLNKIAMIEIGHIMHTKKILSGSPQAFSAAGLLALTKPSAAAANGIPRNQIKKGSRKIILFS